MRGIYPIDAGRASLMSTVVPFNERLGEEVAPCHGIHRILDINFARGIHWGIMQCELRCAGCCPFLCASTKRGWWLRIFSEHVARCDPWLWQIKKDTVSLSLIAYSPCHEPLDRKSSRWVLNQSELCPAKSTSEHNPFVSSVLQKNTVVPSIVWCIWFCSNVYMCLRLSVDSKAWRQQQLADEGRSLWDLVLHFAQCGFTNKFRVICFLNKFLNTTISNWIYLRTALCPDSFQGVHGTRFFGRTIPIWSGSTAFEAVLKHASLTTGYQDFHFLQIASPHYNVNVLLTLKFSTCTELKSIGLCAARRWSFRNFACFVHQSMQHGHEEDVSGFTTIPMVASLHISSHDWCTCFWSHTSCKRLCYGSFCIARKSCQIWHCLLPSRHCSRGFSYGLLADLPLLAAMRGQVQKDEAPATVMENSREWTDPSTSVDTNVSSLIGILVRDSPTPGNYNWLSDIHSEQVTWQA